MQSYYWFDFETFGVNPAKDRPSQFAGVRTDLDFNIIGEPLNIYCKPANDFLPHPEACLVTGITPQLALEKGLNERDFFRQIQLELSQPGTCGVGYNNIRFDDEVLRYGFYRNFYDPYAREWQDGNSRWDILDLLRMTQALRPEGINWPRDEEGRLSFRLEMLSKANGVEHENAHDALADVIATIEMAKLVKQKQPKLFDYLFQLRDKRRVMELVNTASPTPFIHCSGMLGPDHDYCGVMLPLAAHPKNKNSVICIDLCKPFDCLEELSVDEITTRIFNRQDDLPEGVTRLPIKEVHFNKCPAIAPLSVLNSASQERLNIDLAACQQKAAALAPFSAQLRGKLLSVYQQKSFQPITNPDWALYSGGFFTPSDKRLMDDIRGQDWQSLASSQFSFKDNRLSEMLFRYRARNAPELLSADEKSRWDLYRQGIFFDPESNAPLVYQELLEKLNNWPDSTPRDNKILLDLRDYCSSIVENLTISE